MRLITGMLTALCLVGCGQAEEGAPSSAESAALPAANADVGAVSSALRVGRRREVVSPRVRRSLHAASERLSDLQADRIGDNAHNGLDDDDPDDGGWDFTLPSSAVEHTTAATPENVYGATALGLAASVRAGADATRFHTTLLGAGLGSQERKEIDSPTDFVFLPLLAEIADDAGWSALARARYDAKVAAAGGALKLGQSDRDARHAAKNDGLITYDLAWYMLGAIALDAVFPGAGYAKDGDTYAGIAVDALTASPPLFDVDGAGARFYTQGLAWSLVVLAHTGTHADVLRNVRAHLRSGQASDGSWGWNAGTPTDDLQSTAHVVQALALTVGNDRQGRAEARAGERWLLSRQLANGGWEFSAGTESPLADSDVMLALYLSELFPDPGALEPQSDVGQTAQPLTLSSAEARLVAQSTHPLAAPLAD